MRHTETTPEGMNQNKLDQFWTLIEDKYEEEWRVDSNGEVLLVVDDELLERILTDNVATAWYTFGAHKGGLTPEGQRYFLSRPEHLRGTYIIKGIYAPDLSYIPGDYAKREYFFVQEGF